MIRLDLNDASAAQVRQLLESRGLHVEREAPALWVGSAAGREEVVAAVTRRGRRGLSDFRISGESEEPDTWRAAALELGLPFRLEVDGHEIVDPAYCDRRTEVAEVSRIRSPLHEPPLEVDPRRRLSAGGRFELTQHLFGFGSRQLWIARGGTGRLLATTTRSVSLDRDTRKGLAADLPGVFAYEWLGTFDDSDNTVLFERLPPGVPAAQLALPLPIEAAVGLALALGEIMLECLKLGEILTFIRPETIWVEVVGDALRLTGLTQRHAFLFGAERTACYGETPIWVRRYHPEQGIGPSSLSFTLALLLVEWACGVSPIKNRLWADYVDLLPTDPSATSELPKHLAALVRRALEPGDLPLDQMVAQLRSWRA